LNNVIALRIGCVMLVALHALNTPPHAMSNREVFHERRLISRIRPECAVLPDGGRTCRVSRTS